MKKIIFLSALTFCFTLIWAQVPDSISQRFSRQYPDVKNQTWKTEDDRYRVTYRDNNNLEQTITYDKTGQIYSRQNEVSANEIPGSVSEYYSKNYPGESKYKVYRETDVTGVNSYYIDRKGERIYFDNQGTFKQKGPMNNTGTKSNTGSK